MFFLQKMSRVLFLFLVFLCSSSFVFAKDVLTSGHHIETSAEVNDVKNEGGAIHVPPPIEGLESPYNDRPSDMAVNDIVIVTSDGNQYFFNVEMAVTPLQQKIGYMDRESIPENTGILFVFPNEGPKSFWMKNTLIPLDIIFIRSDGIVHHIHHMAEPGDLSRIKSEGSVMSVLELSGGTSESLNINIGDRILHDIFAHN